MKIFPTKRGVGPLVEFSTIFFIFETFPGRVQKKKKAKNIGIFQLFGRLPPGKFHYVFYFIKLAKVGLFGKFQIIFFFIFLLNPSLLIFEENLTLLILTKNSK